jgi:hypothetical protein
MNGFANGASSPRPLDGLLVVSIEQALAAPLCTARLAEMGARVIKIERAAICAVSAVSACSLLAACATSGNNASSGCGGPADYCARYFRSRAVTALPGIKTCPPATHQPFDAAMPPTGAPCSWLADSHNASWFQYAPTADEVRAFGAIE